MSPAEHGGGLAAARRRFGGAAVDWLDLSTGINPWSYPVPDVPAAAWQRLPDEDAQGALAEAARAAYGAPATAAVVAAPGSQALLQLLPGLIPPAGPVAVVEPTYNEHAHCWARAGHAVVALPVPEAVPAAARVLVVGNPNNPDGRAWPPAHLLAASARLRAAGGLLVVDEAFADVAPDLSLAPRADMPGVCVLRSFGKMFGLAGLRLGFALCDAALGARLAAALGPWAVAGPALAIGRTALADRAWLAATRKRLATARPRLAASLAAAGLRPIGGTDLFVLAACDDAARWFERLSRARILARRFGAHPGWLRFGLPPDEAAHERLHAALR